MFLLDAVRRAGALEVVGVDGPDHDAAETELLGVRRLQAEGDVVIVANPHVVPEHVGDLVGLLPHDLPKSLFGGLFLTDLCKSDNLLHASHI